MPDRNDTEIDDLLRSVTDAEMPADVQRRLATRLTDFRTRLTQHPPSFWHSLAASFTLPRVAAALPVALALLAAIVLLPRFLSGDRLYAAAVEQLTRSRSLAYTIVLNQEPYVAVDVTWLDPGYQRVNCSWGIEIRTDKVANKQIVLLHLLNAYLFENQHAANLAGPDSFLDDLQSLPRQADQNLGTRDADGEQLTGYRVSRPPDDASIPGLQTLDVWVATATGRVHSVEIATGPTGGPLHRMFIRDIQVDAAVDQQVFDLTPPVAYHALHLDGPGDQASSAAPSPDSATAASNITFLGHLAESTAVVLPMSGDYTQASSAVDRVEAYLKENRITPAGPPFGRFSSTQHWDCGFPVPPGTRVDPPFQTVTLPAGEVAVALVNGPWGLNSDARWAAFLKAIVERRYLPTGPPTEIWSGVESQPATQFTEMRIAVKAGE